MLRCSKAFTLIELLVVISIISLLIAILLPTLSGAYDAARSVQCLSQVRQLMTATNVYTIDYKGVLPWGHGAGIPVGLNEWDTSWTTLLPSYIQGEDGNKQGVWFCPSHKVEVSMEPFLASGGSYARVGVPNPYTNGFPSLTQVEHPSETMGYYDRQYFGYPFATFWHPFWYPTPGRNTPSMENRHPTGANGAFVFMDNHAKTLPEQETQTDYELLMEIRID